jgi:PTH1 family peptidyl-tRNA hydrolase
MILIAGLGNPGGHYAGNRHNVGFMALERLIHNANASLYDKSKFKGELYRKNELFFLMPHTFMNLSGESVKSVLDYFKIQTLIVLHDDIDLAPNTLRIKLGGGNGGHNGLKSIDKHCGANYLRVRIGIGRPEHKHDVANYCLSDFNANEKVWLRDMLSLASDAALALCDTPLEQVVAKYSKNTQ